MIGCFVCASACAGEAFLLENVPLASTTPLATAGTDLADLQAFQGELFMIGESRGRTVYRLVGTAWRVDFRANGRPRLRQTNDGRLCLVNDAATSFVCRTEHGWMAQESAPLSGEPVALVKLAGIEHVGRLLTSGTSADLAFAVVPRCLAASPSQSASGNRCNTLNLGVLLRRSNGAFLPIAQLPFARGAAYHDGAVYFVTESDSSGLFAVAP